MNDIWLSITVSVTLNLVIWLLTLRYWRGAEKKKNKKNDTPGTAEREARVFKLYQEIEGMLDSFEQYVTEVHEELERERTALHETSRQAHVMLMQSMEKAAAIEKLAAAPPPPPPVSASPEKKTQDAKEKEKVPETKTPRSRLSDRDRQTLDKLESKSKRVRFLMSRGFAVDEVARELDIGIGEVRLIADLDRS